MLKIAVCSFLCLVVSLAASAQTKADEGWIPLFDGRSLKGWKAGENAASFRVENGQILCDGPTSHLFYAGQVSNADFRNFELKAEVMTRPGANSGIFFHTRFQQQGWPAKGFEVQVCNTCEGEGEYRERKKTASLYGVRNIYKALAKDNEWFQLHFSVRGKQVQIRMNGLLVVDYVEPDQPMQANERGRVIDHGAFALQCHDPGSKAFFKNVVVKPLPDDLATPASQRPVVDDLYRELLRLSAANYPLVDYHVHVRGGFTLEDALRESRRLGIQYGVAVNCGLNFPITNDAGAEEFLKSMKGQPVWVAMQAEGREWVKMFSKETVAKFDYVFTDAMTFTDDKGKRMRLWIKEEVGEIPDKQAFMEMYLNRILSVLNNEPVDIYVNPTFLPAPIAGDYDQLWTPDRMQKVIAAARKNDVAIEINNRYRLPSPGFLKAAKKAGVKFSCGTNNSDARIGRNEYCVEMIKECGLAWQDFFVPRPDGQKPVQRRGF